MKEWKLTFNAQASKPWEVYTHLDGMKFFKGAYEDQLTATKWIRKQEMKIAQPLGIYTKGDKNCACDEVLEASLESFPASDPPAFAACHKKAA